MTEETPTNAPQKKKRIATSPIGAAVAPPPPPAPPPPATSSAPLVADDPVAAIAALADEADSPSPAQPRSARAARAASAGPGTVPPAFANLLKKAKKQSDGRSIFAGSAMSAGSTRKLLPFGLPFPSLAMAWGMGSNVWPASRVAQIVGLPGGGKSILCADVARWILELCEHFQETVPLIPGTVIYEENEIKKATDLVWSILEHRAHYDGVFCLEESFVMDDWVRNVLLRFKEWPQLYDNSTEKTRDNPGWVVPLGVFVDSLCGTQTQQAVDKALEDLSIDQAHARRANALTNLAGVLPNCIGRKPIWFIATNHVKEYVDANNQPKRNVPGGRAFQHIESTELELRRIKDLHGKNWEGFRTGIKFVKNCFGTSRRVIEVEVKWTDTLEPAEGGGEPVKTQWTMVDWPTADIELLERIAAKEPEVWARVSEHLDLHVAQGRVRSETLGISKVTRHEAGCVLNERPDVLDRIMPLMGITMGRMFLPGMDYQKEAYRTDVGPDSMALRPYRRPTCGVLTGLVRGDEE